MERNISWAEKSRNNTSMQSRNRKKIKEAKTTTNHQVPWWKKQRTDSICTLLRPLTLLIIVLNVVSCCIIYCGDRNWYHLAIKALYFSKCELQAALWIVWGHPRAAAAIACAQMHMPPRTTSTGALQPPIHSQATLAHHTRSKESGFNKMVGPKSGSGELRKPHPSRWHTPHEPGASSDSPHPLQEQTR